MGFFAGKRGSAKPNQKVSPQPGITHAPNDEYMELAYRMARDTVPMAIKMLKEGMTQSLYVKIRLCEDGQFEQPWVLVNAIIEHDKCFTGTINNDLKFCTSTKKGDVVVVKFDELTDWMCRFNGMIAGNYTLRAMMRDMPEDKRNQHKQQLMPQAADEIFGI